MNAILIPLKPFGRAKNRLTSLTPEQKFELQVAMARDVLRAIPPELPVYLVTGEQEVSALGSDRPLKLIDDPGAGLNAAISAGWSAMLDDGCERAVVVQGDLPMLDEADLLSVLERSEPVVVGPSEDGGTSILATSPPGVLPASFGPDSAQRHIEAATRLGLPVAFVDLQGGRFDVDDEHALRRLAGLAATSRVESCAVAGRILGLSPAGEAQAPARS